MIWAIRKRVGELRDRPPFTAAPRSSLLPQSTAPAAPVAPLPSQPLSPSSPWYSAVPPPPRHRGDFERSGQGGQTAVWDVLRGCAATEQLFRACNGQAKHHDSCRRWSIAGGLRPCVMHGPRQSHRSRYQRRRYPRALGLAAPSELIASSEARLFWFRFGCRMRKSWPPEAESACTVSVAPTAGGDHALRTTYGLERCQAIPPRASSLKCTAAVLLPVTFTRAVQTLPDGNRVQRSSGARSAQPSGLGPNSMCSRVWTTGSMEYQISRSRPATWHVTKMRALGGGPQAIRRR